MLLIVDHVAMQGADHLLHYTDNALHDGDNAVQDGEHVTIS